MLELKLKEIKDGVVYYYYQIEGEGKWGLLYRNLKTDEEGWIELAEGDTIDFANYRNHAFTRIDEYIEENHFPDYDLVAWG